MTDYSTSHPLINHTTAFSKLTKRQQALLFSAYAYELTIVAREGYMPGEDGLSQPQLLRRVNEVQHRVTSALLSRLTDSKDRYPDDVLVKIIGGAGGGDPVGGRLHSSFRAAWRIAFGTDPEEHVHE